MDHGRTLAVRGRGTSSAQTDGKRGATAVSLLDVVVALRRFSVVFLTILFAAAGATYFVWTQVPVVHLSEASIVILLPNQQAGPESLVPSNPYQSVGDSSTSVAADALVSIGNSPEFQARLANEGVTSVNTIEVSEIGGGVILELTASNTEAATARADVGTLVTMISQELRTRQIESGAPESSLLTADVLISPSNPTPLTGTRTTVAAAVAVIGVIIALAAVVLLEFLHRPRRKSAVRPTESVSSDDDSRRPVDEQKSVTLPPTTMVPEVLAVIDQALALSEPEPADEPQSEDPPSDVLPLPFDDPIGHRVTAGWPVRDDEGAPDPMVLSDDGDDGLEKSSVLADWMSREQVADAEAAASRSEMNDSEEGSASRESGKVSFTRS